MRFLSKLFGSGSDSLPNASEAPFLLGDRIRDAYGYGYTVIRIKPPEDGKPGGFQVRRDDGNESRHFFFAHGFTLLAAGEQVSPLPYVTSPQRVKPEETAASAFLLEKRMLIHGDCITNMGGLACRPCEVLDVSASDSQVGTALLEVLKGAQNAPVPTNLKAELKEILRMAKVSSFGRLNSSGHYCHSWMTPNVMTVTPSKRENRRGFSFLGKESVITIPVASTADELGRALRLGFSRCQ